MFYSISDAALGIGPSSRLDFYIPNSGGTAAYIDPAGITNAKKNL